MRQHLACRDSVQRSELADQLCGERDFLDARGRKQCSYGYQPWRVETFVDTKQLSGACYRAANWTRVGASIGRGRQDRERKQAETIKDIYVYVLADDFRTRLGLPAHSGLGPLPLDVKLETDTWAEREFGGAPPGDQRLSKGLVRIATAQAESLMLSFAGAVGGDKPLVKGIIGLLSSRTIRRLPWRTSCCRTGSRPYAGWRRKRPSYAFRMAPTWITTLLLSAQDWERLEPTRPGRRPVDCICILVGRLGGYLDRKGDPPPGHQVLWIGYSQLRLMCAGFLLGRDSQRAIAP